MLYPGIVSTSHSHSCLPLRGFKVSSIESSLNAALVYERRDCYKLCLLTGKGRICYGKEEMEIDGSILFYARPNAFYSWESFSQKPSGYSCLFTEEFLSRHPPLAIFLQSPIVGLGGIALCPLNQEQKSRMIAIFGHILSAQDSDYVFKQELISACLLVLIHEALKM